MTQPERPLAQATLAVHAGGDVDAETGAVAPPIHLATTFAHGPAGELRAGHQYQRESNPTQDRLEAALAALEGGTCALAFASGMAAISALVETFESGSHVILPADCYVGLRMFAASELPVRGIACDHVDLTDPAAVAAAIRPQTRLLWAETPSNPMLRIVDIAALSALAKPRAVVLAVDNTFATPLLQQPLALGADVVMHSTTKYIGGHSDVLGGALVFSRDDALAQRVRHRRHMTGAVPSPFAAWLVLRGCRSLPARMAWHCRSAAQLAQALQGHPALAQVLYPGLPDHPGHALAATQMRDFGAMLGLRLRGGRDAALRVAAAVRLFTNATSLGGVESLIEHRASVEGARATSPGDLLRVSVGLEAADDLLADLLQALARA